MKLVPDDAQYVLALCEPTIPNRDPICTALPIRIKTSDTKMVVTKSVFPERGPFQLGVYKVGHSGRNDFPKYLSQVFVVKD